MSAGSCTETGIKLFREFYHIDPTEYSINDIKRNATSILQAAFRLMVQYKEQYNNLGYKNISSDCVDATRKGFLALRSFGDYIGYVSQVKLPAQGNELPAGTLFVNTNLNDQRLKSGDVIISRGNAYSSAVISRVTDTVTQFSHLAIVYIDPKDLKKYVIEAHIEQGTIVTTWEKYIQDGKIRALVMRQNDAKLAHNAAQKIYNYIIDYQKRNHKNVPYDFGMQLDEPSELFCSEVVQLAYKLGSQDRSEGTFRLPQFLSQSTSKNVIKEALGINEVKAFFSPNDVEVDTRFSIVAEYKNYELINQAWGKDAMITFLFDLWNKNQITLRPSIASKLVTKLAMKFRNTSWGRKNLVEKVPENGPYEGVLMMTILNVFASADLDEWLENANKLQRKEGLLP